MADGLELPGLERDHPEPQLDPRSGDALGLVELLEQLLQRLSVIDRVGAQDSSGQRVDSLGDAVRDARTQIDGVMTGDDDDDRPFVA